MYAGTAGDNLVFELEGDDGRTYTLRMTPEDVRAVAGRATSPAWLGEAVRWRADSGCDVPILPEGMPPAVARIWLCRTGEEVAGTGVTAVHPTGDPPGWRIP